MQGKKSEQDGNFQLKNLRMKEKADSEKERGKDKTGILMPQKLEIKTTSKQGLKFSNMLGILWKLQRIQTTHPFSRNLAN